MAEQQTQYWLAELDKHGNSTLIDGPHDDRSGAEEALTLMQKLNCISTDGREFAIGKLVLTPPTGEHGPVNESAIDTLNNTLS